MTFLCYLLFGVQNRKHILIAAINSRGLQCIIFSHYPKASFHHSQPQPPLTTTTTGPNTSATIPDSSGPALAQDHSDGPRYPSCAELSLVAPAWSWIGLLCPVCARVSWSFGLPLAVIVSITLMALVASVIGVVCFRLNAKHKQSGKQIVRWLSHTHIWASTKDEYIQTTLWGFFVVDKCGERERESLKQQTPVSVNKEHVASESSSLGASVSAPNLLHGRVSWKSLSPTGSEWCSLHNSGLQSSAETSRGLWKPARAQNTSGGPQLHLERRAGWDGGVLHTGPPPVKSEPSVS